MNRIKNGSKKKNKNLKSNSSSNKYYVTNNIKQKLNIKQKRKDDMISRLKRGHIKIIHERLQLMPKPNNND